MLKKYLKRYGGQRCVIGGLSIIFLACPCQNHYADHASPKKYSVEDVPQTRVVIVFGAGLLRDGSAGPVLSDRMQTAVKFVSSGKADKILMSGDNRFVEYNEPEAGRQYALERGVRTKILCLIMQAGAPMILVIAPKHIFGVDEAILVTQEFHMPRPYSYATGSASSLWAWKATTVTSSNVHDLVELS
jgi:vancomycin permeability regulator SanA